MSDKRDLILAELDIQIERAEIEIGDLNPVRDSRMIGILKFSISSLNIIRQQVEKHKQFLDSSYCNEEIGLWVRYPCQFLDDIYKGLA